MAAKDRISRVRADDRPTGSDYTPHLRVGDVSSRGRSSRIRHDGRTIHTLSDLETRAFRDFQWDPSFLRVQEQFALDLEDTVAIAKEMGVDHPVDPRTKALFTMTTDFVVWFRVATGERRVARAVKPAADLELAFARSDRRRREIERTIEKLEIERRYWSRRNVDWAVVTDNELSKERQMNIESLVDFTLDERPAGHWQDAIDAVARAMISSDGATLGEVQRELADAGVLSGADFTSAIRWLCAGRHVKFDMDRAFTLLRPVSDFEFVQPALSKAA